MGKRKKILILEGNESDRRELAARLSDEYEIRSASAAREVGASPGVSAGGGAADQPARAGEPRRERADRDWVLESMVGSCDAMREAFSLLRRAAAADAGVMIVGECGTGKERAARAIHAGGSRREGRFVTLNAEAFGPARLEVELLGRKNGAAGAIQGALEQADGGTLLLCGLDHLPHGLQSRLLAYLRTGRFRRAGGEESVEVDVRVLVASDHPPEPDVESGKILRDLFYRLGVVTVVLPPLRERGEDAALLARDVFERCAPENGSGVVGLTRGALRAVMSHDWPGNIAEMENRIRRALIVAGGRRLTADDLGLEREEARADKTLREARDQLTRDMVVGALRQTVGNVSRAARSIGVSRATMYDLIRKYELDLSGFKDLADPYASPKAASEAPSGAEAP